MEKNSLTVLAINFNSTDFADLLIDTCLSRASKDPKILIVDNSFEKKPIKQCQYIANVIDNKHGTGIQLGLMNIDTEYTLLVDVDCHFISNYWDHIFLKEIRNFDCITVKGSPSKPIRVACVFMKTDLMKRYDWRDTPGYQGHRITPDGFDVGIQAYHQMKKENNRILYMSSTGNGVNRYKTHNGEEYGLNGVDLIYHHWHGTHLKERAYDYPGTDLLADKALLFSNFRLIKKIPML